MGIQVQNSELVSARELTKTYASLIERLASGELEKVVLTRHGKMEAVLITADEYERLLSNEKAK